MNDSVIVFAVGSRSYGTLYGQPNMRCKLRHANVELSSELAECFHAKEARQVS